MHRSLLKTQMMMLMTLYGLWHVVDALALKKKP